MVEAIGKTAPKTARTELNTQLFLLQVYLLNGMV